MPAPDADRLSPAPVKVTVLTQPSCTLCDRAGQVLYRLASEYSISAITLDARAPEAAALAERGESPFAPAIFLDGEPFSYGRLSERKLRRELDRRGARR